MNFSEDYARYNLSIAVNGREAETVATGAPVAVHVNGQWYAAQCSHLRNKSATPRSPSCRPLVRQGAARTTTGRDSVYGAYTEITVTWLARDGGIETPAGEGNSSSSSSSSSSSTTTVFETHVRTFSDAKHVVAMGYSLPSGAAGTAHAQPAHVIVGGVITNFPAFSQLHAGFSDAAVLSWQGIFVGSDRKRTMGATGGPTVWHRDKDYYYDGNDGSGVVAIIAAPRNHFKATGETDTLYDGTPAAWVPGVAATYTSLPASFRHDFLVFAGSSGVTDTVWAWGQGVLKQHSVAQQRLPDPTLTGLSYQTDNGAMLCFCKADCDRKLLAVTARLQAQGVPVRSMSFQGGWWDNPKIHTRYCAPWCVTSWQANHTKVPMGVPAFQEKLGLPLQLYAPYFCADSPYARKYNFLHSDTSLEGCGGTIPYNFTTPHPDTAEEFYTDFMSIGLGYGMASFEPDFMQQNFACVKEFVSNVSASPAWLRGMGTAALKLNLPVQFCMATPTDLLEAVSLPAVTNFRASNDFFYGTSWDLGLSSLLIWALGSKPSKDTFWTSDNGGPQAAAAAGGCPGSGCPADHCDSGYELHTLLAVMATGPVGFSDALGQTNVTRILQTCTQNGTLLQPSKAATAIDATLRTESSKRPQGHVLATFTSTVAPSRKSAAAVSTAAVEGAQNEKTNKKMSLKTTKETGGGDGASAAAAAADAGSDPGSDVSTNASTSAGGSSPGATKAAAFEPTRPDQDNITSYIVIGHQLTAAWSVTASDLWPHPPAGTRLAVRDYYSGLRNSNCEHGAPMSECVRLVTVSPSSAALSTKGTASSEEEGRGRGRGEFKGKEEEEEEEEEEEYRRTRASSATPLAYLEAADTKAAPFWPRLFTLATVCDGPGAWTLLGELNKFVAVSAARFTGHRCSPTGMEVDVAGDSTEEETLSLAMGRAIEGGTVSRVKVTVKKGVLQTVTCSIESGCILSSAVPSRGSIG